MNLAKFQIMLYINGIRQKQMYQIIQLDPKYTEFLVYLTQNIKLGIKIA